MIFVETAIFTKRVLGLLSEDSYGAVQTHLAKQPDDGDIIRGGGGLRKIRWAAKGHGKRGGVRVKGLVDAAALHQVLDAVRRLA